MKTERVIEIIVVISQKGFQCISRKTDRQDKVDMLCGEACRTDSVTQQAPSLTLYSTSVFKHLSELPFHQ